MTISYRFFVGTLVCLIFSASIQAQPVVGSLSPGISNPGSSVIITGSNFNTTPANNIVYFGATKATASAASTTSLTVTVPSGATFAPVSVNNAATNLVGYSQYPFLPKYDNSIYIAGLVNFDAKINFAGGSGGYGIAIGDLDGDGKADAAVCNAASGTVSVYKNTSSTGAISTSSFTTKVDFTVGTGPDGVAIADVDGDGKLDLVVSNFTSNTVSVLRNTTTSGTITSGSFTAKVDFGTGAGAECVEVADVDVDGKPDLIIGNYTAGTVSVIRNTSVSGTINSGSFATKVDFTVGSNPERIAVGDIDGDGKSEIVVANSNSNSISILRNTTTVGVLNTGSFAAKVDFTTGVHPIGVAIGDIDADGKQDICVTNNSSATFSIFRNVATGGSISSGSLATRVDITSGTSPVIIKLADIDGDSKPDMVVTESPLSVSVYRNIATTGTITTGSVAAKFTFTLGDTPNELAVGDIDGDGKPEILSCNSSSNGMSILRNNPLFPPPTVTSLSNSIANPGASLTITGTNFNTTPANNIVYFGATKATVSAASTTSLTVTVPTGATFAPVSVNNTATNVAGWSQYPFLPKYDNSAYIAGLVNFDAKVDLTAGSVPIGVGVGDLDGDGKSDLVVSNQSSNTISIYRNTSTTGAINSGSFAPKVDLATGIAPNGIAIRDIDGDGKPEIVVGNASSASISVFRNIATAGSLTSGSFAAKVDFVTGTEPNYISTGDIDGDGKLDIAITNSTSNTVSIFRNTATTGSITSGSLATKVDIATGTRPIGLALTDFDGDGKVDLVTSNYTSNNISVFRNTAILGSITSGSFSSGTSFATGTNPTYLTTGDLDGDGKQEIAVSNYGSSTVSVFRNTATSGTISSSSFATKVDFATTSNANHVAVGDIDGDGKLDIVATNYVSSSICVMRNIATSGSMSTGSFAVRVDFPTGANPYYIAIADLDGDGRPEIVTPNSGSASITFLRNNPLFTPPTVTSLSNSIANPGASLTITGTYFNTTPANNIVYFGATKASVTSASTTSLTVTVPTGATFSPVSVNNTATNVAGWSQYPFLPKYDNSAYIAGLVNFDAKVDFGTGSSPIGTEIADIDGDGKSDIIVANSGSNSISIYRNISSTGTINSGSFATKVDFATGSWPSKVAVADLDGDGKPDIVVNNENSNTISIFRNVATGGTINTGSLATRVDVATGTNPGKLAIADVDDDGKPDLIVPIFNGTSGTTIAVYKNQVTPGFISTGSFGAPISFTVGLRPTNVSIGDIDGDGKRDIVVGNSFSNTISILRNTGSVGVINSGSFATKVDFATGTLTGEVKLSDIDGDSKLDIVVATYTTPAISVFRNTSTSGTINSGSLATRVDFVISTGNNWLAICDIDGNGKPDLLTNNNAANTISVLLNTSTTGTINSGSFGPRNDLNGFNNPYFITTGDLDGDSKPEIVVVNEAVGTMSILRNNPLFLPPTVTSLSNSIANPGTSLTITGTNFNATPSNNIVYFGATKASVTAASTTSLTVTVPVGATHSRVSVINSPLSAVGYSQYPFLPKYDNSAYIAGLVNFDPKVDFATGSSPTGVAIGDLDGDGKSDVVVTNNGSNTISVYRNTSASGTLTTGSFATKVDFATGSQPGFLAIHDIDGDGKLDIVVSNIASSAISVFRNIASAGAFTTGALAARVDFTTGTTASGVAITDIDGDGKADIAVSNYGANSVGVFRNMTNPGVINSASLASRVDFATGANPSGITFADVDGDGKSDLCVANTGAGTISILRNTATIGSIGSGSFATKVDFTANANTLKVIAGDIDGDGKIDLAVNNSSSGFLSVFRNTATSGSINSGSLAAKVDFTPGTAPEGIELADIDGDGKIDMLSANYSSNTLSLYRNIATSGTLNSGSFAAKVDFTAAGNPIGIAVGDLDGDGKADGVLVNRTSGSLSVFRNNPLVSPPTITSLSNLIANPGASLTITGDHFNTTPANNIVYFGATKATVSAAGTTSLTVTVPVGATYSPVSVNNTALNLVGFTSSAFMPTFDNSAYLPGTVNFNTKVDFGTGSNPFFATAGDIDGDGKPDLVLVNQAAATVYVYRNLSATGVINTSSFGSPSSFNTPTNPYNVVLGDMDGDGKLDMVTGNNGSGNVSVFRNTSSSGSVSFATRVDISSGAAPVAAIADMDNDGKPDIVTANYGANSVSVIKNNSTPGVLSTGTFAARVDFATGTNPFNLAVGDLDGDGRADVATANASSNNVSVLRNTATFGAINGSSLASKVDFAAGSSTQSVAFVDIDGDNKPEIVAGNYSGGSISVFRNTASAGSITSGSFAAKIDFTTGSQIYNLSVGDINGDGKADIATANFGSTSVSVLLNTATSGSISSGSFASRVDFTTSTGPQSVAICDVDADNKPDLIVANYSASTVSVFQNNPIAPITGTTAVCQSSTTTLTDATTGGFWTSSNPAVATIGTGSGIVTGVSVGTAIISYSVVGGRTTVTVTVNPTPSAISGTASVCAGATTSLTNGTTGGVWSSSNTGVAAIGTTGLVNGVAAGTAVISYTTSCGSATVTVTVNPIPSAISGPSTVCQGASITLTNTTTSGVWSSSNTGVATVGSTGLVNGITAGTVIVSYVLGSGCYVTSNLTVNLSLTSGIITTVAGSGATGLFAGGYSGDGGNATAARLNNPVNIAVDRSGNIFIADNFNNRIRKVAVSGIISTIAGIGSGVYSGNGGQATAAGLYSPKCIAINSIGELYIADNNNHVIRKISTSGVISTVAGTGTGGYNGDGGLATNAQLNYPYSVVLDAVGNIYISDGNNHRVRKVSTTGIITTIAGTGTAGFSGDNGPASTAMINNPMGIAIDTTGNLYIGDISNRRIRKVDLSGNITTVVGTGVSGYSGDGGSATSARINSPDALAFDASGNLYIADENTHTVRKVNTAGIITTIAGTGSASFTGDGGLATAATLFSPTGVATDNVGNVYVSDFMNNRIRKISSGVLSPIIGVSTICQGATTNLSNASAGGTWSSSNTVVATIGSTGTVTGLSSGSSIISYVVTGACSSSVATTTITVNPLPALITGSPSVCLGASTTLSNSTPGGMWSSTITGIASIGSTGIVTGVNVGTSIISYITTCGSTTITVTVNPLPNAGSISGASSVVVGADIALTTTAMGGVWSSSNTSIAIVGSVGTVTGVFIGTAVISYSIINTCGSSVATRSVIVTSPNIYTFAGNGSGGYSGDGGIATAAGLYYPQGVVADRVGNVYIADGWNNRIRKVSQTGIITTIAGNGTGAFGGDGGPATAASFNHTTALTIDSAGNIYISDYGNYRVRKISTSGIISTIAGNGTGGYSGDGSSATTAMINHPYGLAVDNSGNVYIADIINNCVRRVSSTGIITTIAGNGTAGYGGDGGMATASLLNQPSDIEVDNANNVYIADQGNNRIRKINPSGIITTIAGGGTIGLGDGGLATNAQLNIPTSIAFDGHGNFYIADEDIGRIRKVNGSGIITTVSGTGSLGFSGDGGPAVLAELYYPYSLSIDTFDNLYVADVWSHRIRVVGSVTHTPFFTGGPTQTLTVCQNATSESINSLLAATDLDVGQTETWTITGNPSHGALSGFSASATSTGSSVTPTGLAYTPTSGYTGTDAFTIQISDGTYSSSTTISVTVNPLPNAGTITGASTVCVGSSIGFSNTTTGGTWSSASGNVSVSGSTVTGVSAGTAVISYMVTNSCGSAVATTTITVNPLPNTGTIAGASAICVGSSIGLSNSTIGGIWSSASGNVSISGSTLTGVSAGSAVISYSITNGCGIAVATATITVNPLPNAGTITSASSVCVNSTLGLTSTTSGGTWSTASGNVSISGSTLTGVSAGSAVISYSVTNVCGTAVATATVIVNAQPITYSVTGGGSYCSGGTGVAIGLSNSDLGINYQLIRSGSTVATVSGTGSAISFGSFTTAGTYSVLATNATTACSITMSGSASVSILPLPNAGTISGASSVGFGSSITLTASVGGGVWSSTGANATVSSGGVVTGVSAGTEVISYTVTNTCGSATATKTITVNTTISGITGTLTACPGGTTTLSSTPLGGTWTSSNSGVAVIGFTSGIVSGISGGTSTITYSVGSSFTTAVVTIVPPPAISGGTSVCNGQSITLSNSLTGGTWVSGNSTIASIGSTTGIVTGASGGTTNITYYVGAGCSVTTPMAVNNLSPITGASSVCVGQTIALNDVTAGGAWSSSDVTIATVDISTGVVTGVSAGAATITYTTPAGCIATAGITVNGSAAISGASSVCVGQTTTLTNALSGGVWSSNNALIASIGSSTGIMTGNSSGSVTISYTTGAGCVVTMGVAVNALSPITGSGTVCVGQTTALSIVTGGGTWSSSDVTVATIDMSTGVVTGVSAGAATITYTTGAGCVATTGITVNASAAISGVSSVCVGQTTSLTNTVGGGTWSSNNALIASIGSVSGIMTGNSSGSVTISYTTGAGCVVTMGVAVNALSPITGSGAVCVGQTTPLSIVTAGGTWSSSDLTVATIDMSTGVVTGVSAGAATITYTTGAGCVATTGITVNASAAIAGPSAVCLGQTITLTNAVSGGAWVSGNTTIATVDATTGVVTGVSGGAVTLSYTTSSGCVVTKLITVNTLSPIGGPTAVCSGQTITLTDATIGGTWMSAATGIATIGSASGLLNGISVGSTPITYTTPAGCFTTTTITVTTVASITGPTSTCVGQSITLSNATPGGVWISGNGSVASIGSSTGLVTGLSTGGVVMSYTIGGGCSAVYTVNVNAVGPISGATSVCTGQTTSLSNYTTGGRWTSSDITVASVGSSTGVVTGVATGTTTISYTMPTGCVATSIITSSPVAATAGPSRVCNGQSITLTNSVSGGIWTSGNTTIATVRSATGIVNGGVAGSVVISYTTGSGCRSTFNLTVATISAIGGVSSVCGSQSITLTDASTGGTWSSSNLSVASVGTTGIVVGANAGGTAIITYSLGAGCVTTKAVTVNPFAPISGLPGVCVGQTITLTDAQPGGIWSSSNPASGSIGSSTGIVTGRTTGVTTISYTLGGCRATQTVNVSVLGSISGTLKTCVAQNTNLSNTGLGGLWSSSNTAIGTVVSNTGAVTGVSAGTFIITYAIGTSCIAVATVTVNALDAITGPTSVCVGQTTTLSNTTPAGGTWSSGNNTIATIGSTTGIVTGVTGGALSMSFTVNGTGCRTTYFVTVNALSAITGATSVCQGSTATLTEVGSGTWSSSNTGVATIGTSTGVATGVSAGTATVSFIVNTSGCTATKTFTVHPADVITGSNSVCISTPITLSNSVSGGTWSATNPTIARVGSATGIVTGLIAGPGTTITYTTPRGCRSTKLVAVGSCRYGSGIESEDGLSSSQFILIPNPNKGEFTIRGTFASSKDEEAYIEVVDMLGQVVYRSSDVATSGRLNKEIKLEKGIANGMYILNVRTETERKAFHFVVSR